MATNMDPSRAGTNKLFAVTVIDSRDDYDEKLDRCYNNVASILKNAASETEANEILSSTVCKSAAAHEDVCIGLMIRVLTDPQNASRHLRDLTFVSQDGLTFVIFNLNVIIVEKYPKLQEFCKGQIVWMIRELIKANVSGIDSMIFNLFRQIPGGDISTRSLWLAESLLDVLSENRPWLDKNSSFISSTVYTYLRLIVDHHSAHLKVLRQKEIEFTAGLLKERFVECMVIGRDLVRLLQYVARIPEFEQIWKDIQKNPSALSPTFTGIVQLMHTRTSRKFLICRLTPDMERKLVFLTSHVKFGQQKRYQDWFQKQYLSTPESQSLRCDLIRFICGVIHPSNELLCSDVTPRWAVIGWILSSCTSNVAAANAKLSLFYDWLFYDVERDNIMNIEPAILVMFHSIRSHPVISATLLDFLCRILPNYFPPLNVQVRQGLCTALQQILEKRVLQSLGPLFETPKLDNELRILIRKTFPEFCSPALEVIVDKDIIDIMESNNITAQISNGDEPEFSDDDVTEVKPSPKKIKTSNSVVRSSKDSEEQELDFDSLMNQIEEGDIKECITELQKETDSEQRCEIMEKLIPLLLRDRDREVDDDVVNKAVGLVLREDVSQNVFPDEIDEENLEDSIGTPLFVIFRNLCETPEDDPDRLPLLLLLCDLASIYTCIGYLLLYYVKVSKTEDVSAYKEFSKNVSKDLSTSLFNDLRNCQDDDVRMFCFILPDVYKNFENLVISNAQFLHLAVSCVDASQLQDLICDVLQGDIRMLKKESVISLVNASLSWETYEQYCLWQLIAAHNIQIESILPVLPKLEFKEHSEALTSILLALRKVEPTQELLKHVINRDVKSGDQFVVSVLKFWLRNHEKKLAELIGSHLSKSTASPAKRGKRQTPKNTLSTTGEQILTQLDLLRQQNKTSNFFNNDNIQSALQSVQSICNDAQKSRFSDLFSLAEEVEVKSSTKRAKTAKGKTKAKIVEESNSETEGSEEEEVKPKKNSGPARKKRKTAAVSDSD
ncbi:Integrator complex subunit 3 [Halotydeus destructor]|nr:Integrator complex subunit 3 [Halotydeus destructor]